MLKVTQLVGLAASTSAAAASPPTKDTFDYASSSTPGTSSTLSVTVSSGLLVFAVCYEETGGAAATPTSATVVTQGAATQIVSANSNTVGVTWYYYVGNTTDGAQDITVVVPSTNESFSIGCWSFGSADAADILSSDSAFSNSGAALSLPYSGAGNSFVLHAGCIQDVGETMTGETDFTVQISSTTGAGGDDHGFRFEDGLGSDVRGNDIDFNAGNDDIASAFVEVSGV